MRSIIVLNSKGGCGKTTLATNIASYYASQGNNVALADYDSQGSSLSWLNERCESKTEIKGIPAWQGAYRTSKNTDYLIMDSPAAISAKELAKFTKKAQTALLPVLPSPIDIRAAAKFVEELLLDARVCRKEIKLAVIANRVKENTNIYSALEKFLKRLNIPFIATIRDTQNYIKAAEQGLGIFEMAPSVVAHDLEQWKPLTRWLNGKRSMP